ncbi:MAG: hypothetical protein GWO20_12215 [Candidatus Korarchaeota archaeon]|nr:hypothetical protein [Candidatus Korarchaeota archaeon]NIU84193.1 hypothetical protein [Candidatus Thorarchaeota archaeon]NIW14341.1 hypothetical protein [Candidatus Thorarchaeota archaeon]NIW52430.1 hypothetical protein [Candidatus Korarchaeota archaeon]
MSTEEIVQDFAFLHDDIEAILLFNPQEKIRDRERSDVYIILVAPHSSSKTLKEKIRETINLEENKYHVGLFGDLNLKLQHHIIEAHEIAWKQPDFSLSNFFATYRRRWNHHRTGVEEQKRYLLSRGGFIGLLYLIAYFFPSLAFLCIPLSFIVILFIGRKVVEEGRTVSEGQSTEQLMTKYMVFREDEAEYSYVFSS